MFNSIVAVTNTAEQAEIHPDKWDFTCFNVAIGERLVDWEPYDARQTHWGGNGIRIPYREPN